MKSTNKITVVVDKIYYELDLNNKEATVIEKKYNKWYIINSELVRCEDWYSGSIHIPQNVVYDEGSFIVTTIGKSAFSESSISSIQLPESISTIDEFAFYKCNYLKKIVIPKSVIAISKDAFNNCENLSIIKVDNKNEKYDSRNNCNAIIETSSNTLIRGCKTSTIVPSINIIGQEAFAGCKTLKIINIPNSVTSIHAMAFRDCIRLSSIFIPESVEKIGIALFFGCKSLKSIEVDPINSYYASINNTIIEKDSRKIIASCKTSKMPVDIVRISKGAFSGNDIERVCLPEGLTHIETWSFYLSKISKITIPNSVRYIGKNAFNSCSLLSSIFIPQNITDIKEGTFQGCSSLESITIPDSVKNIEKEVFYDCSSLSSIILSKSLCNIGESAFAYCSSLESITIPDSVKNIEKEVFYDCSSLSSIILSKSLCNIGESAFAYCSSLESITIPNSVENIEKEVFYDCSSLSSIILSESLRNIGESAFAYCSTLESITIPDSVEDIEKKAFDGCSSLSKISIPKGQKTRFAHMEGLKEYKHLLVERDDEETTTLFNLAKAYLLGIGVQKNIAQAAIYYTQAAEKGSVEAAYQLAEWYRLGDNLPKNLDMALNYYQKAAKAAYKDAQQKADNISRNQIPKPMKTYLFFDTECNGLPRNYKASATDTNNWPHLIQLAWIITNKQGVILKRQNHLIYPQGFTIDSEVATLTGINTHRAQREGIRLEDALSEFMADLDRVEKIIGHNIDFDRHIVGCELYRTGGAHNTLMNKPKCCTMQASSEFCAIPSNSPYSDYKWPKLEELYRKLFGKMFDNAHDALSDVTATKECYFELKKRNII